VFQPVSTKGKEKKTSARNNDTVVRKRALVVPLKKGGPEGFWGGKRENADVILMDQEKKKMRGSWCNESSYVESSSEGKRCRG